jgi:hypothetical protein
MVPSAPACPCEGRFLHWLVRRSGEVLRQVLVSDVVDMWEKISVVDEKRSLAHVVPFGWRFIILPIVTCKLHFVCLLLHRCWEGIWNVETATMLVVVAAQLGASYIIYQVRGLCIRRQERWFMVGLEGQAKAPALRADPRA